MVILSETRRGFKSTFTLKCNFCSLKKTISTDNEVDKVDINEAAVLGMISTGIGYSQCDKLMSALNVPFMTPTTFQKKKNTVLEWINNAASIM